MDNSGEIWVQIDAKNGYTVYKFQDFSGIQNLREINFEEFQP